MISSVASRLVTFETAAVGLFKSPPISNHCPRAIAMVPPHGKEKWRKDIDEWKRVGRALSFREAGTKLSRDIYDRFLIAPLAIAPNPNVN